MISLRQSVRAFGSDMDIWMHFTIIVALNSNLCRTGKIEQIEEDICTTLVLHI